MKSSPLSLLLCLFVFIAWPQPKTSQDSAKYYYKLLASPQDETDVFEALEFYTHRKTIDFRQKDTTAVLSDLRQIAIAQNKLGWYHESESTSIEALKLLQTLPESATTQNALIGLYNQLGRIYKALLDYDRAIECYDKAFLITDDDNYINIIRNNKAVIFKEIGDYEKAEEEFKIIYDSSLAQNNPQQLYRALDNLGFVEAKLHKSNALEHLHLALKGRIKEKDLSGTYSSYRSLATYYLDRSHKDSALYYTDKAIKVSKEVNSKIFILDAIELMMDVRGDTLSQHYKSLKDSIGNARQLQDNKYALFKYNYYEQEQKAQQQSLQTEKEKLKKQWYQLGALLLIISSIPVFLYINSRNRRKTMAKVYETENTISKKVHDEVANDVYRMMAKLQSQEVSKEQTLDDLELIYHKTRDISKSIDNSHLLDDYKMAIKDLLSDYQSETISIIVQGLNDVDLERLNQLQKQALYRAIQELMTNMKKHSGATLVVWKFQNIGRNLNVEYRDNGLGCEVKVGNGLRNTENRIRDVGGTITFESDSSKGFRSTITL